MKQKNGWRLTKTNHQNGVAWFQVNTQETDAVAADVAYDGSDYRAACRAFGQQVSACDNAGKPHSKAHRLLISKSTQVYTAAQAATAKRMRAHGSTLQEIADHIGCSNPTAYRLTKRQ